VNRSRPARLQHLAGIGVDRMGSIADAAGTDWLRLENLDVDIMPDPLAIERTRQAATEDANNSYLPFVGQDHLRDAAAMERLLFDGREPLHPAGLPGMAERTITVGSSAKELRMIGWRRVDQWRVRYRDERLGRHPRCAVHPVCIRQ
jgi:hypothetical protein